MSAYLKEHQAIGSSGQGPTASVSGGFSPDDSMTKISAGPAALAQLLIYQTMALYLKIVDLDQQQKVLMSKAQYSEAKAQADATIEAGKWLGYSMIAGAAVALAGVAVSFGFNVGYGKAAMKKTTDEMKENEAQMAPLKKINELAPEAQSTVGAGSPPPGSAADKRLAELRNEDYEGSNFKSDPKKWTENTRDALGFLKKDLEFKQRVKEDLNRLSQDQNTNAQTMLSIMTQRSTGAQQINTVSTALGQASQGIGNVGKANNDAVAGLNQTAASIAGALTQEYAGAMSKALDAALQAIRTLLEIHRANSVQG